MNKNFLKSILKKLTLKFIVLVFFLLLLISTYAVLPELTIGSWNLMNFGERPNHIAGICGVISKQNIDILLLQEIKSEGKGVKAIVTCLREMNRDYNYAITKQVKKSPGNAEGYAVLFKNNKGITLEDLIPGSHIIKRADEIEIINAAGKTFTMIEQGDDYNFNQMVRPPMECNFLINDENLTVYNSHITFCTENVNALPGNNNIQKEIEIQEAAISERHKPQEENIVVGGDFNAGGKSLRGGLKCEAKCRDLMPDKSWYDSTPYKTDTAVVCSKDNEEPSCKSYDHIFISNFMKNNYDFEFKVIGPPPSHDGKSTPKFFHNSNHRLITLKMTPKITTASQTINETPMRGTI